MRLNRESTLISIRIPANVKRQLECLSKHNWCGISDVVRSGIRREFEANINLLDDSYPQPEERPVCRSV